MSDKFNKDNDDLFSSGSGQPDDDDALDWLQSRLGGSDEPESSQGDADMPWQQAKPSSDQSAETDDDGFANIDWNPANTGPAGRASTGLTGQLPWLQSGGAAGSNTESADPLDWMADIPGWESEPKQEKEPASDALPEWLATADVPEKEPDTPAPEPKKESIPEWLNAAPVEETSIYEVPDWLSSDTPDDTAVELEQEYPAASEAPITAEWLASAGDLPEISSDNLTYTEWQEQQEAAQREPDPEEEVPEWFGNLEDIPPAAEAPAAELPTSGELPSWYLGMQELDTSDAPEWFVEDEQQPAESAPTAETTSVGEMDWSQWETVSEPEPEHPAESATAAAEDDFFTAMGSGFTFDQPEEASADEAVPTESDYLSSLGIELPNAEPDLQTNTSDYLSGMGIELPDEIAPAQANDDDFFASMGIELPSVAQREVSEDDFLSSLGIGGPPVPPVQDDDFLSSFGQAAPLDPDDDDFLSKLGIETPAPMNRDLFNNLNTAASDRVDWFAEQPEQESSPAEPDWMQQMDSGEFSFDESEPSIPQDSLAPAEDDFLADIRQNFAQEPEAEASREFSDLDSFLSSLDVDKQAASLPDSGKLSSLSTDVDFDKLLADSAITNIPRDKDTSQKMLNPDAPEWLADIAAGAIVGGVSGASIVRQRKDKPLDELPERLQRLHDLGDELPPPGDAPLSGPLAEVLAGVNDTLPPAPIKPGLPGMSETVALTERQRERIKMMRGLVATESIDATALGRSNETDEDDDDPFKNLLPGGEPKPEPVAVAKPTRAFRQQRMLQVERLLVTLVLALAVIAPFFIDSLRVGILPPASFEGNTVAQSAYNAIDTLNPGDLALIGVEYSPGSAAELDLLTASILRHVFSQGARPVLVGSTPTGLLHVGNLVEALGDENGLRINQDYYVARYLTGSLIGVRALAQDPSSLLITDRRGLPTGLNDIKISDFRLLITIAESGESVRAWSEGIVPLVRIPLIAAVSSAASPLSVPYALGGMLVGYRDGYTYNVLLGSENPGTSAVTGAETETDPASDASGGTPEATQEPAFDGTEEPALNATKGPQTEDQPVDSSAKVSFAESTLPDADSRWYAMTLGIMVSAAVITFGALVNILRRLLRRPQR